MRKYQLASGKILEFNLAGIEQALELYRAVLSECKNAGLDFNLTEEDKLIDVLLKNKEALLNIASSSNVMEQIKLCCNKVIYNKQKFSMELFEDEKARGDFFAVMVIVGLENIRPFFPSLHMFFDAIASLFLKA